MAQNNQKRTNKQRRKKVRFNRKKSQVNKSPLKSSPQQKQIDQNTQKLKNSNIYHYNKKKQKGIVGKHVPIKSKSCNVNLQKVPYQQQPQFMQAGNLKKKKLKSPPKQKLKSSKINQKVVEMKLINERLNRHQRDDNKQNKKSKSIILSQPLKGIKVKNGQQVQIGTSLIKSLKKVNQNKQQGVKKIPQKYLQKIEEKVLVQNQKLIKTSKYQRSPMNDKQFDKTLDFQIKQNVDFERTEQKSQQNNPIIQQQSIEANQQQQIAVPKIKQQFIKDEQRNKLCILRLAQLYEVSQGKRYVERQYQLFVRPPENQSELFKNYGIRQSAIKNKLRALCDGIQPVRGDGNCFYTAFGYQFLKILLLKFSDQQFYDFIKFIKNSKIEFKIYFQDFTIDNEYEESQLLEEFLYRLERIRLTDIEERLQVLYQEFSAFEIDEEGSGCFYGLSTIFFRNLANHLIEFSPMKDSLYDRENLLKWETECNSNEIVIQNLAEQLNLHVQLIFFQNQDFNLQEYCQDNQEKIILLIRPGHYNIGLQINSQQ